MNKRQRKRVALPLTIYLQESKINDLYLRLAEKDKQIQLLKAENESVRRLAESAFNASEAYSVITTKLNELATMIKGESNEE